MFIKRGDVIGTKDGRYGTVNFVVNQDRFLVYENIDPDDPCDTTPNEFWTGRDNVASIV